MLRSTVVVAGFTLLSRLLGFARDLLIASLFGANGGTDAFFVAFKIPNFLRRLFAEGAFSQAFIPVLSQTRETADPQDLQRFVNRITGSFALVLVLLTGFGILLSPSLVWLFAPGFRDHPDQFALTQELLEITFPYLFFIAMTALAGGLLNTFGFFAIPAFTPALLNGAMMAAAVWLAPRMEPPILALGIGVFIGGALQLLIQVPALLKIGLLDWPRIDFSHPGVRRVITLMTPALFGASVTQLNLLINTFLASLLTTGSISWLYYSDRLVEFPLGIFGVGLGTVILPYLSKKQSAGDLKSFSISLDWALRWWLLIGTPATLALIILAEPLMFSLFQHDQFTPEDARMAARSLVAYGLGLMGFLGVKIMVPAFSAQEDLKTPALIGIYCVGLNVVVSVCLALWLAPPGWGHAGLALSASLAATTNAILLGATLVRRGTYQPGKRWGLFGLRLLAANLLMALFLIVESHHTDWSTASNSARLIELFLCVTGGLGIFLVTLIALGLRPRHLLMKEG